MPSMPAQPSKPRTPYTSQGTITAPNGDVIEVIDPISLYILEQLELGFLMNGALHDGSIAVELVKGPDGKIYREICVICHCESCKGGARRMAILHTAQSLKDYVQCPLTDFLSTPPAEQS